MLINRKKRPVDKLINNILINFEKNIKKEFVLMVKILINLLIYFFN